MYFQPANLIIHRAINLLNWRTSNDQDIILGMKLPPIFLILESISLVNRGSVRLYFHRTPPWEQHAEKLMNHNIQTIRTSGRLQWSPRRHNYMFPEPHNTANLAPIDKLIKYAFETKLVLKNWYLLVEWDLVYPWPSPLTDFHFIASQLLDFNYRYLFSGWEYCVQYKSLALVVSEEFPLHWRSMCS